MIFDDFFIKDTATHEIYPLSHPAALPISILESYLYKPPGKGPYPAVIVLHHKGGLTEDIKTYARSLSEKNFVTIAIDYYSGGGWLSHKVGAAYDYLQKLPEVDPKRIGMLGFSRGALEGTRVAIDFQNEYPVRPLGALVSYYIGRGVDGPSSDLPPILFLHGDNDKIGRASCRERV